MSVRNLLDGGIRKVVGNHAYTRLKYGYQPAHSYVRKIRGIIHVGANEGQERDLYAAFGLDVVWIEPIPDVFATLKRNVYEFPKQRAFNYLVTSEDGKEFELHIADNRGASSSILALAQHTKMFPDIAYERAITLTGATLISILAVEQIDVGAFDALVLDTQGTELRILQGAASILSNFKFIKVEVPDFEAYAGCCQIGELSAFMSSYGFRERNRHIIFHMANVGTYFDVVYEQIPR